MIMMIAKVVEEKHICQFIVQSNNQPIFTSLTRPFIPELRSCVITVTGFTNDSHPTRDDVKAAIEMAGACYLGSLCKDITTHLLVLEGMDLKKSVKYNATIGWDHSVRVVHSGWLFACLQQWRYLPEQSFSPLAKAVVEDVARNSCIDKEEEEEEEDKEKIVSGLEIESELDVELEEGSHLSTTQDGFSSQKMVGHPHPEESYNSEVSAMSDMDCSKEEDRVIVNTLFSNQSM